MMRALIITLILATPANAFNALGHKTIAEIAWRHLPKQDRQQIVDVLRRHPRFDDDFAGKMTDDVLEADKTTQDRWIHREPRRFIKPRPKHLSPQPCT